MLMEPAGNPYLLRLRRATCSGCAPKVLTRPGASGPPQAPGPSSPPTAWPLGLRSRSPRGLGFALCFQGPLGENVKCDINNVDDIANRLIGDGADNRQCSCSDSGTPTSATVIDPLGSSMVCRHEGRPAVNRKPRKASIYDDPRLCNSDPEVMVDRLGFDGDHSVVLIDTASFGSAGGLIMAETIACDTLGRMVFAAIRKVFIAEEASSPVGAQRTLLPGSGEQTHCCLGNDPRCDSHHLAVNRRRLRVNGAPALSQGKCRVSLRRPKSSRPIH